MATARGDVIYTMWQEDKVIWSGTCRDQFMLYTMAQCTPSREGLYTAFGISVPLFDDPIPVKEDSVFAPRKVEVECVA